MQFIMRKLVGQMVIVGHQGFALDGCYRLVRNRIIILPRIYSEIFISLSSNHPFGEEFRAGKFMVASLWRD